MPSRREVLLGGLASLGLALAPVRAARAVEAVSVQLNWKHQFEFAAFYAAVHRGFYRDVGLDVHLVEGGPGVDAVREVVQRRCDFGVGTSALVVDRARGAPVVALATLMQHSPVALLASRAQGVQSVLDLVGKPVSVDPHTRDEVEAFLRASGLPRDGIRLVEQTDWTLAPLERGDIAAKSVYASNEPFLIRGREHAFVLLTPRSAGVDLFGNMLFTTEATLALKPGMVDAFRQATLKGMVYALDHPEELVDLIIEHYNPQGKSREHLLFEAGQIRELTRPDIVEPGYMSPGRWRHVVDVYASQGALPEHFSLEGFLYDPTPRQAPAWLFGALTASLVALFGALGVVAKVRSLNRALKASEAEYRELVDNANALILRVAPDGTVTYFNERAEAFFGFAAEEIIGKHVVGTIVPPVESGSGRDLASMMKALLAEPGSGDIREQENITRDGRRVFVRWANRAIQGNDGAFLGVLSVGQDITARRLMEQELAAHRQLLEAQVAARTEELALAKEAAEAASRAKTTFLANMSHEIRTPLNAITGTTHLLRRSGVSPEQDERLDKIETAGQHLLEIINAVLDLSKIEAGKLTLERTALNVDALVHNVVGMLHDRALAKGLTVEVDLAPLPPSLCGDPTRIQQALLNFGANAIKFTPAGGRVTLRTRIVESAEDGVQVRFEVEDTGIGIPPDKLGQIFRAFEQADTSTTREYGGTGLGLAITRKLADLMGGMTGVRSEPGQGSTFWFTARLVRGEGAVPVSAGMSGPEAERRLAERHAGQRLLLVEDEEINRDIAVEMLAETGLLIDIARDGVEALERVAETDYSLILMDMQMPRMDGLEATRRIRALPGRAAIPIVAMTANAFAEDRARCFAAGMDDFVPKPVEPEVLVLAVLRGLERRAAVG
ncbi:MAG: ABC transporter substrate-binding protein [Zoogloea sp.]|nr:ABC transporter substrate-binding protein [Zoogloea sp.]